MISSLPSFTQLPDGVVLSAQHFDIDDATLQRLDPELLPAALASAVLKRRIEFLAGRHCARTTLRQAGYDGDMPLAIGDNRAPQWPAGWIGAITHSHGAALAAVAPGTLYAGLGIDIEPWVDAARAERLSPQVGIDAEWALRPASLGVAEWFTAVFSMKESLFKALYPQVRRYFGFHDAEIVAASVDTATLRLTTTLSDACPQGAEYALRLARSDGFVLSLCAVPASDHR
ncbi:4'-phosphopantetheinyl transferase family protein [Jeongeupia naejangsanensis]|uniref:Enterobactin synthase component D n=1 Tax=Jeongeupia naejangsanensis TaxID=613195 RepID=A0ABS2BI78_9NEIS|nr:4'-phosphopantetheinyl transferase superfamily protein [Jeongeupia naejangsanensis]MBM3115327.1 4'-phosphopantetheinyl transferase superfamily protein [Jeongeupia naejangsanensis]